MRDLDKLIKQTLRSLFLDMSKPRWYGREREIVSLYAFGHLVPRCKRGGILHSRTQIAIEVAVPQLRDKRKRKRYVCKDVVIWPHRKMTVGNMAINERNYPLAILEMKSINRGDGRTACERKRIEHKADIDWLRRTTKEDAGLSGFAVLAVQNGKNPTLECVRLRGAHVHKKWLLLPKRRLTD